MQQNQKKRREKISIACITVLQRIMFLEAIVLSSKKSLTLYFIIMKINLLTPIHLTKIRSKVKNLTLCLIFSESNILIVTFALFVKLEQNKKKSKKKYQANGRGSLGDRSRDS